MAPILRKNISSLSEVILLWHRRECIVSVVRLASAQAHTAHYVSSKSTFENAIANLSKV